MDKIARKPWSTPVVRKVELTEEIARLLLGIAEPQHPGRELKRAASR